MYCYYMYIIHPQKKDFDHHNYATKKTVSKGLLNFGLVMTNISQLRHVVKLDPSPMFYTAIVLISLSLLLQAIVAVLLFKMGFNKLKSELEQKTAIQHNNVTTAIVAVITALNVVIASLVIGLY